MSKSQEIMRGFFREGNTYRCEQNTRLPERAGAVLTLDTVGKSYARQEEWEGFPFHISFPTRLADIVSVTDTQATYIINEERDVVTWSLVQDDQQDLN